MVQTFKEMHPDSSEENFAIFLLCVKLWSHPYQFMGIPHIQSEETTLNIEANLANKQAYATMA